MDAATRSFDFNPRSPHGERPRVTRISCDWGEFQSTLPARGATAVFPGRVPGLIYFNPRSPHGERPGHARQNGETKVFQSTLPARGATEDIETVQQLVRISIHAPRTGSDRTLRNLVNIVNSFQSTLPARGATAAASRTAPAATDFNPRSPHGERRQHYDRTRYHLLFQSTLPARGATRVHDGGMPRMGISIHAPRTGSDLCRAGRVVFGGHFNPRSPHGERLAHLCALLYGCAFQSTLPARGATYRDD